MFRIEFSDQRFRLVAPDGEYEEAVGYCSVSTVEYNGVVYAAYLDGDEDDIDTLSNDPNLTTMKAEGIRAYPLTDWPNLGAGVDVELEEIEFEEDEPDGPVVDVKAIS